MAKLFRTPLFPLATTLCYALGLSADFAIDFDSTGDFANGFAGFSDFSELTDGGINGTGAVSLSGNSQVAVYQMPVSFADQGKHVLSMFFQYNGADGDGGTGRGFAIGYTSTATDAYDSSATTTGLDMRAMVTGSGSNNAYGIDLQNDGELVAGSSKDITLILHNWYYLELTITDASNGSLDGVAVALYDAADDGTVGEQLKSLDNDGAGGYTLTSALANAPEVFPFFGGQNPATRLTAIADSFAYSRSIPLPEAVVYRGTPLLDGALDSAWNAFPMNELIQDIDGTTPAAENLSGYWKAMWDDENLYFLLVTVDDAVVAWPGNQFWNYDMTELFIDADYSRNDDVLRYDENDFQLYFPRDGQVGQNNGPAPVSLPLNYVQATDGNTTVIELALPWAELTVAPIQDMLIGIDVYMKDNDTGTAARDNQISWSPSMDEAWRNPSLFGTGRLSNAAPEGAFVTLLGATLQADGSYVSDWFGNFTAKGDWINHASFGWLYTGYIETVDGMWFWSAPLNAWVFSESSLFPIVFNAASNRWIYYLHLVDLVTYVYDFSTETWALHP